MFIDRHGHGIQIRGLHPGGFQGPGQHVGSQSVRFHPDAPVLQISHPFQLGPREEHIPAVGDVYDQDNPHVRAGCRQEQRLIECQRRRIDRLIAHGRHRFGGGGVFHQPDHGLVEISPGAGQEERLVPHPEHWFRCATAPAAPGSSRCPQRCRRPEEARRTCSSSSSPTLAPLLQFPDLFLHLRHAQFPTHEYLVQARQLFVLRRQLGRPRLRPLLELLVQFKPKSELRSG